MDRSTISKILISAYRWTGPPETPAVKQPKPPKQSGGRFPIIEDEVFKWWDGEDAAGREVKDADIREQAKEIARRLGFDDDRFKASNKWLEKFKDRRRKTTEQPDHERSPSRMSNTLPPGVASMQPNFLAPHPVNHQAFGGGYDSHSFYAHSNASGSHHGFMSGYTSPAHGNLSRSQSSTTLASMESGMVGVTLNGSQYLDHLNPANGLDPGANHAPAWISDVTDTSFGFYNRQRSRSSPQRHLRTVGGQTDPTRAGTLDPASGRAARQVGPVGLQRSQSTRVGGASPGPPKRPGGTLHRNHSSVSSISSATRRSRPPSLAASAFGLTPMQPETPSSVASPASTGQQPNSASQSQYLSHTPDRRGSNGSVQYHPNLGGATSAAMQQSFQNSMSGMNISPEAMSSAGTMTSSSSSNSIQQQQQQQQQQHQQPSDQLQPQGSGQVGQIPLTPLSAQGHQFGDYLSADTAYPPITGYPQYPVYTIEGQQQLGQPCVLNPGLGAVVDSSGMSLQQQRYPSAGQTYHHDYMPDTNWRPEN